MSTFETIQPVTGVKLYTCFSSVYFHGTTAIRFETSGSQIQWTCFNLVQYVAVVVSGTVNQLLEFIVDTFAYGMRSGEVHWSTFYFGNFSGWDRNFIDRRVEISVDSNNIVFDSRSRIADTSQIEETVIGQVDYSSFVSCGTIFDYQCIFFFFQAINHFNLQIAGETFFAVGWNIIELDYIFSQLVGIPNAGVKTGRSSVQGVGSVVDGELVLFSVQCEFSFGDAVAIASDSSAEEGFRAVDNVVYAVVSEDNVCIFSIFIRYHDSENGASVISYGDFHSLFIFEDK